MIGSAIGGYVDPEVIKTPGIGDAQNQTSSDGVPIPVVYGSPPPFMGNLIDGEQKARKIKVETQQGKGGPVVESEKFLLTSAIGICEGEIAGLAFVIQDGKLVYDTRPVPKISAAETAKFASKVRIYTGSETQLPDPSLEAIHGVGNTPYYRGLAYIVIVDDDRTQTQGRVGQYAFGVVKSGTTDVVTVEDNVVPRLSEFAPSHDPRVDLGQFYKYKGFWTSADGGGHTSAEMDTIQAVIAWCANLTSGTGAVGPNSYGSPGQYLGYVGTTGSSIGSYGSSPLTFDRAGEQPDVTDFDTVILVYQFSGTGELIELNPSDSVCLLPQDTGQLYTFATGEIGYASTEFIPNYLILAGCFDNGTNIYGIYPLCIQVIRQPVYVETSLYGDPCELRTEVTLPDAPGFVIDCDGVMSPAAVYETVIGVYAQLAIKELEADLDGNEIIVQYPLGPILDSADPNYGNEAFWTAEYNEAVARADMQPGGTFGFDYPFGVSEVLSATTSTITIEPDAIFLREIQEDLATRCDVPPARIDADELAADEVPGYLVAVAATGADASRTPQMVYFYDMPEEDGAIRCRKRGASSVVTITSDNFVDVDSEDDDIRSQQVEYPKKIHLAYPDPAANYAITKQTFARESFNVYSVDEQGISTPIPFTHDEAARRVDVLGKVAWATAEGRIHRTLPQEFCRLTPSDCFLYAAKRWRIEKAVYGEGTVSVEAVYDRISAYASIATGAESRPPATETSGLKGPTLFEFVNLSPLLDSQDKIGIYFGVAGILEGWQGAAIFGSIDAGAHYTAFGSFVNATIMGYTQNDLPVTSPWVFDPDATVTVKVHGGEPETGTFLQLLNEGNAAIIGDEVIQYLSVTEDDVNVFTLTGLTRARHNTAVAEHAAQSRFVVLRQLNFVELPSAWIGKNIRFYIQSLGTPDGTGYVEDHVWIPATIQTEWSPFHLETEDTGTATELEWIGRGRLGSTASPFHSSFFDGYRLTFTDGVISKAYVSAFQNYTYTDVQRTADFGGLDPLDVSIVAMNRITGPSAALTGTI